jgi:hypothetical protein
MKVTRWEEKLFNVLVDEKKDAVDERKIERYLNYYYQRMDIQDLLVAGRVADIESNYELLEDLGMHALFSIYCAKGKDFDQVFFKKEMKELGFHRFFAHKIFAQLEIWRNSLPEDITDDEVKGQWTTCRNLPESDMILAQRLVLIV